MLRDQNNYWIFSTNIRRKKWTSKTHMDKWKSTSMPTIKIADVLIHRKDTFEKKRNQSIVIIKFFSHKQNAIENLQQIWNALSGLASKCEFGARTEAPAYDILVSKKQKWSVQERFAGSKKADGKKHFNLMREEWWNRNLIGLNQQRCRWRVNSYAVYHAIVCSLSRASEKKYYRYGAGKFRAGGWKFAKLEKKNSKIVIWLNISSDVTGNTAWKKNGSTKWDSSGSIWRMRRTNTQHQARRVKKQLHLVWAAKTHHSLQRKDW